MGVIFFSFLPFYFFAFSTFARLYVANLDI